MSRVLSSMPKLRPGVDVGDPAPPVEAHDETGAPFSSLADQLAGQFLALIFCGAPDRSGERLRRICAERTRPDTVIKAISPMTVEDNRRWAAREALPCRVLADGNGQLFSAYGLQPAAVAAPLPILLDSSHRVAAIGDQALPDLVAGEPARLAGHPPVLVLPRVLSEAERAFLIATFARDLPVWSTDGFTNPGFGRETGDFKVRHAGVYGHMTEYIVQEPALQRFLDERLQRRIVPQLGKAFGTTVTQREGYRILGYAAAEGGSLAPHRDNPLPSNAHRRFTLTVNLNAGDYRGGELRFPEFGDQLYDVPAGTAVLWSASLLHQVLPVTAGMRLVCGVHLFGGAPT